MSVRDDRNLPIFSLASKTSILYYLIFPPKKRRRKKIISVISRIIDIYNSIQSTPRRRNQFVAGLGSLRTMNGLTWRKIYRNGEKLKKLKRVR